MKLLARTEWTGAKQAVERLRKRQFTLTGKDPKMYGAIQQMVYRSTATNFGSQGRPKWKPRSATYEAWAMKKYGTFWPPLLMTGKLLDTTLKSIQAPWQHLRMTHLLNIKSIWYGLRHQYGGTFTAKGGKKSKLPKRPYISITKSESNQIVIMIRHYMAEGSN